MGENLSATERGWGIKNKQMQPTKTDFGCAPSELLSLIRCNCKAGCSTLRCSCRKHGLVCTPACGECRGLIFLSKSGFKPIPHKPEVLPPTSAAAKYHSFRVFYQVGWVKTLVRLNGDGGSRINRCNQRRQTLDVRQVNCCH